MTGFLHEVVNHKQAELKTRKSEHPLDGFKDKVVRADGRFGKALSGDGLKIIAEIKPRSPSLGQLDGKVDISDRLKVYQQFAQAVSVLCDQKYFGGSVKLLEEVSAIIKTPTLLKDFVIDPYQVYEARYAGAQAVLLIVKILDKSMLSYLNSLVLELGMTPLVEVQTEDEVKTAEPLQPEYLLINNRNLDTLKMDLGTVERLVSNLKYKTKVIAASGIESTAHLLSMRPFASRFLIGSSLMNCDDPAAKFQEFLAAEKKYVGGNEKCLS